ncbi:daf-12-interacting protein 1 [Mobula hypostoma]|uniref:daf-12-interacting protein 1 n=1 Tax=Mobula hypostoma TaxID=723540 RepID=UPI002FC3433C
MGGRLGRKRRGYNVSEPAESRTAAESTNNPEVKQVEPKNKAVSKDQGKTTGEPPEQQSASEAPKQADEGAGEKQAALIATDVEAAEINEVAVASTSEPPHGSEVQGDVNSSGLVEAEKQLPDQTAHYPSPEAGEPSSATAVTDLAAEVPESGSNAETLKPDLELGRSVAEDISTEKSSLGDQAVTSLDEQLEESCGNLDVEADPGKVLKGVSEDASHTAVSSSVNHEAPSQETEMSVQERQLESQVKCDSSKEDEEPKLTAITEETPIDVVLKNEVAMFAVMEKDVTEPNTGEEVQGAVNEPLHSTTQATTDIGQAPACAQHSSTSGGSCVAEIEDHGISLKESESPSVDLSQVDFSSVTDAGQADPVIAESAPEDNCPSTENVTETSHEQTAEPMGCQDSVEAHSVICAGQPDPTTTESVPEDNSTSTENVTETSHEQTAEPMGCQDSVEAHSVICAGQPDPTTTESVPEDNSTSTENVTETSHEQSVEPIGCQDSVEEISLLKTSSELIPDIKLTVCGEGLQEEEVKDDIQPVPVDETVECIDQDANIDLQAPNEVQDENQSALDSTEITREMHNPDQKIEEVETSGDPTPESQSSTLKEVLAEVNTEEINSTENSTDGKLTESVTSKVEDDHPETPVPNGTTSDRELKNQSQVEVTGQDITAEAEENVQVSGLAPIASKTTERVIENLSQESCLALNNETLNSGSLDVNVE